jgi:hypothetical protein
MRGKMILGAIVFTLIYSTACKKETLKAEFELTKDTVFEGETIPLSNLSKGSNQYEWIIMPGNIRFSGLQPEIRIEHSGFYEITLNVKNSKGKKELFRKQLFVKPDTIWRLTSNNKKVWIIASITYEGSELVDMPCKADDEFHFYKNNTKDTFQITEGNNRCPDGSYIFNIPASGEWRFNRSNNSLDFALTAFQSPFNFEFRTEHLSPDSFSGYDETNDVRIRLRKR